MPTIRQRYFRTDSSGGDGTTNNTSGATAAYASLNAALAAERTDDRFLVTNDEILRLTCTTAGTDTTRVLFPGSASTPFETDATRYVEIVCSGAAHHGGVPNARSGSGYVLASSSGANIWRYTAYIKTKGFEITSSALEGLLSSNQAPAAGQYDFDEMIFSSSYASDAGGLAAVGGGGTVTLNYTNCLIVTTGVRNIDCRTASQTVNIDHCGFIGAHDNGIALLIDTATVTNSWAFGQTGGGEDWWTGGAAPTGSHNASSDTSVDTDYTSSLDSLDESNELTNSSTTLSAFDGTLQSGSNLIGAGTGSESVDITGAARTGAVDIGPFNYTSAGDVVIEVPLGPLR